LKAYQLSSFSTSIFLLPGRGKLVKFAEWGHFGKVPSPTIIALATPPGSSALALIRLSGPKSWNIAAELSPSLPAHGQSRYANLVDRDHLLDDVVLTCWKAPASYTGEDVVEISCHGNVLIIDQIINACLRRGAELAPPGEFTRRAFLNGKIDLTRAEAVMDLIAARSERALRSARRLQRGQLGSALESWRSGILDSLAHIEAYIDFPDEDIQPETGESIRHRLMDGREQLDRLLKSAREGRLLREGVTVAIVGSPNAGKSSLLNALLGQERAIVSERAGTTRDSIDACLLLEGIMVRFVDTAGIHSSEDEIEKMGMDRTRKVMEDADLIIHLVDASQPDQAPYEEFNWPEHTPLIECASKIDLVPSSPEGRLGTSAQSGAGLEALKREIIDILKLNEGDAGQELVAINDRHRHHLENAASILKTLIDEWDNHRPPELISSDIRQAVHEIDQIVGQTDNEMILDRLFEQFCIGK
jgi:tRNA modification GTPase